MKRLSVALGVCLAVVSLTATITKASGGTRRVSIEDKCDPATFNAAIRPGTCVRDGGVTFAEFLSKLNPIDFGHDGWKFEFGRGRVDRGEGLQAVNRGGEFHTFTEVQNFGGGCVDLLNGPLELTPVPECQPEAAPGVPLAFVTSGVPSGQSLDVPHLAPGTHRFQCLIHPWMRSVIEVRGK
jgi:hypothetical protein